MTDFWSTWIIVLTTISFVLMIWILFANRKREQGTTEETTGHNYDGIEEYDNPLPAWWFNMFFLTIVWGIGYLIVYPGMGNFAGVLGWTQLGQYEERVATAEERYGAVRRAYLEKPIEEIATDPALRKMGQRMFGNNCAQCHGADAKGSYGFPNLTDDSWNYGYSAESIKATLMNGRVAAMPAWIDVVGEAGIQQLTAYVLSLNDAQPAPDAQAVEAGGKLYQSYCVACHGADATGNTAFGAPDLTNGIWLYGGSAEQIAHSLRAGRNGAMPAFGELLSEDKIHILSAYVYGLNQ
ncbi:MAG: cytochrome-c oxidase, cbb3-type subunit III [Halioglobus sp.]